MPKEVLMCVQCRRNKKCCTPKNRQWPGRRCDRCVRYNFKCSANSLRNDETENAEKGRKNGRQRLIKEILMDLDYIQYLRSALLDTQPSDPDHGRWNNIQAEFLLRVPIRRMVESMFTELKKEAQDIRNSLFMGRRIFEARAIEEMLHHDPSWEASFPIIPLRMIPTSKDSIEAQTWMSSHPLWDLDCGRIFSLVKRFQEESDASNFDHCELIGTGPDDRRSLNLFLEARRVQMRVVNKYITPAVIRDWEQTAGVENIKHLLLSLDPIDLRAVRCLNDEQTVEYMTETNLLSTTLPSLTGRDVFRVAIYEKTAGENPLTRQFFSKRQQYRRMLDELYPGLPSIDRSTETDDDLLHVVVSPGNIWAPKAHPLVPEEQTMEVYPSVELNALATVAAYGHAMEVRRILRAHPTQASFRAMISDGAFLVFSGKRDRVHEFPKEFSVFHLAAWNGKADCLRALFASRAVTFANLGWRDVVDLYAIAVKRRDLATIEELEKLSRSMFDSLGRPNAHNFVVIWSLAVEHSSHSILECMLKGPWFETVERLGNLVPLILNRADYWRYISDHWEGVVPQELSDEMNLVSSCTQILVVWYGPELVTGVTQETQLLLSTLVNMAALQTSHKTNAV
ncbi:hypothetical protein TWF694_002137 [Orbilia ellipsospora]|uniref:Zn(2)-C6 fungal-type domain-containing protein n=1 Tax=Orbilia ellipsospora TaxID=2528407 RepID=A0AAV9X5X9_9PEZI